jgi:hypothetical protein
LFLNEPERMPLLMDMVFTIDDELSYRAAWVLEFICSARLSYLQPYTEQFTLNLHRVTFDSAKRPLAKICEMIAMRNYTQPHLEPFALTTIQKERVIEACFDWLLQDEKVAVKAYSMSALFQFGNEFDWIRPELKLILEKDFSSHSAGFKARARNLLKQLK